MAVVMVVAGWLVVGLAAVVRVVVGLEEEAMVVVVVVMVVVGWVVAGLAAVVRVVVGLEEEAMVVVVMEAAGLGVAG